MTTPGQTPGRVPEERVSAILKRAAELDRKTQDSVTLDTIRAAAVEAGISLSAVDRALEEYAANAMATAQVTASAPPKKQGWIRKLWGEINVTLKYAFLAFFGGLFAAAGEMGLVIPCVVLVMSAIRIAFEDRPTGRASRYIRTMLIMTLLATLAYAMTGDADEDVMAFMFTIGASLLPLGFIAIKTHAQKSHELEEINSTSS